MFKRHKIHQTHWEHCFRWFSFHLTPPKSTQTMCVLVNVNMWASSWDRFEKRRWGCRWNWCWPFWDRNMMWEHFEMRTRNAKIWIASLVRRTKSGDRTGEKCNFNVSVVSLPIPQHMLKVAPGLKSFGSEGLNFRKFIIWWWGQNASRDSEGRVWTRTLSMNLHQIPFFLQHSERFVYFSSPHVYLPLVQSKKPKLNGQTHSRTCTLFADTGKCIPDKAPRNTTVSWREQQNPGFSKIIFLETLIRDGMLMSCTKSTQMVRYQSSPKLARGRFVKIPMIWHFGALRAQTNLKETTNTNKHIRTGHSILFATFLHRVRHWRDLGGWTAMWEAEAVRCVEFNHQQQPKRNLHFGFWFFLGQIQLGWSWTYTCSAQSLPFELSMCCCQKKQKNAIMATKIKNRNPRRWICAGWGTRADGSARVAVFYFCAGISIFNGVWAPNGWNS